MPKFLKDKCKKDKVLAEKLFDAFNRFNRAVENVELFEAKYMEVYEKDVKCGKHIFRLKSVSLLFE